MVHDARGERDPPLATRVGGSRRSDCVPDRGLLRQLSAQGELRRIDPGQWEIALRPEQGFFEIELPKSGQRFGVVSLPQWKGDPDPFFAIDGALSWLERDASSREELILTARRCGIAMVRERLSWAVINTDRWQRPDRARGVSMGRADLSPRPGLHVAPGRKPVRPAG
jgi:hypothetical protein